MFFLILAIVVGWYFLEPMVVENQQTATSDASASKGRIVIGVDNFIGYFPLCSRRMNVRMMADGYEIECRNEPDFARRFAGLKSGEFAFAVGTVDSYIKSARQSGYPGVIVSVIDESRGADAIVARADSVANLDALRSKAVPVAFTPDSPSHHLLKTAGVHFDIPWLRGPDTGWQVISAGSAEALKHIMSGTAQVAVLWEPDLSRALAQGNIVQLLGTEVTEKLIVDVLLGSRDYVKGNEEATKKLLVNYFKTLKEYRDDPVGFRNEVVQRENVKLEQAESMLKGVRWYTLQENAMQWFGLSVPGSMPNFGLKDAIDNALRVLVDYGDLKGNPFPEEDWRRIVYSAPISGIFAEGALGMDSMNAATSAEAFRALDEEVWKSLAPIGTLRIRPILFQSGSAALSIEDKQQIDQSYLDIQNYPRFRILIEGHTRPGGNEEESVVLSRERAEAVMRYLMVAHDIQPNRIHAVGLGSSRPLVRDSKDSYRAYADKLSRVEIHLLQDAF